MTLVVGTDGNDAVSPFVAAPLQTSVGDDTVLAGAGSDTADAGDGSDSVDGGVGNDRLIGGDGADTILGGSGGDFILGDAPQQDWRFFDGHWYLHVSFGGPLTQAQARAAAEALTPDSTLVAIDDAAEQAFVETLLPATPGSSWTAGVQRPGFGEPGGGWAWEDRDGTTAPLTYTNWESGEPNNAGFFENAIDIRHGNGRWNDVRKGALLEGFVVEALTSPPPSAGAPGGDLLAGGGGADTVMAGLGADTVAGNGGDDSLAGEAGDDAVRGGGGRDRLDGGDGDDRLDGGAGDDTVSGGAGDDTARGGVDDAGRDSLDGGAGDDLLDGGDGSDSLAGGDGADTLIGGLGDDHLSGGGPGGWQFFSGRWYLYVADGALTQAQAKAAAEALAPDGTLVSINDAAESAFVASLLPATGSTWTAGVQPPGSPEPGGGWVWLDRDGTTTPVTFTNWDFGEPNNQGGEDAIEIRNGPNARWNDLNALEARVGFVVEASSLPAGLVEGDILFGGQGNDTLDGRAGSDTMVGGAGDDLFIVDASGDLVVEAILGGGADTVQAAVSWTLAPGLEDLVLTGTAAIDGAGNAGDNAIVGNAARNVLRGGGGADTLDGGGRGDVLRGGAGDDLLVGGRGRDRLVGGDGEDAYRYRAADEGGDTIEGGAGDRVEVSASGFGGGLFAGIDLIATGRLVENDSGLADSPAGVGQFVFQTGAGILWWDADGAGGKDAVALFTDEGSSFFTSNDVVVIA